MNLHCLVYVSRISPVLRADLRQTVRSILTQAQHLNARDGVTGLLVFNQAFFAQALEGDLAAVENTYGRIARDERHALATVLVKQPITERCFGSWTMCARQLSVLDNDVLDRLEKQGPFPSPVMSGPQLLTRLRAIGRVHQTAFDRQSGDVMYL